MKEKLLEKEWRKFCLLCFKDLDEQQYTDLRRTFYGGAATLFQIIMTALEPGTEPTKEDLQMITNLFNELRDFKNDVLVGKA